MISNIDDFISYVETQLGKPLINIEIGRKFIVDTLSDILTENNFHKENYEIVFINNNSIERLMLSYDTDKESFILNHPKIKKLVVAKSLQYWSRILGKYEMIIDNEFKINWKHLWEQGIQLEYSANKGE